MSSPRPGGRTDSPDASLTRLARLPIAAAILTIGLKFGAYLLTDSAGLLSDAVESSVNLVAAVVAFFSLWYAAKPVDRSHTYGHEKIAYFSSGLEGGLILVAAAGIGWYSVERLLHPRPLEGVGLGLVLALVAAAVNLATAVALLRAAHARHSVILRASGQHLMTDVWTSVGAVAGVLLAQWTGFHRIDPIVALLIAALIVRTGFGIVRGAVQGLLDTALPNETEADLRAVIERELPPGTTYHALRTRTSGSRQFADFHLLVPGRSTVERAHDLATRIERALDARFPGLEATIHLEPIEDPEAWTDSVLVSIEREEGLAPDEERPG